MGRFSVSQLSGENPLGRTLRQAREAKGLRLVEISRQLKLPARYLEAIEAGLWHELPGGSYARLFVRTYATSLGLPGDELLRQYPVPVQAQSVSTPPQPAHLPRVAYGRRTLLLLGATVIVVYLGSQAWQVLQPPQLVLASPADTLTTFSPVTTVAGVTRVGTKITVNGAAVEVSGGGRFAIEVALSPGLNTIAVVAQKSYVEPLTVVRRVLFVPPNATP